jgi:hypothetical protein
MSNINQLVMEAIEKNNIELKPFNKQYWNSLSQEKNNVLYDVNNGQYHTLMLNNQIVGIVGLVRSRYFQIYIDKKFRGQDIYSKAADLIYKKYKLKEMFATVASGNIQGFKGALKSKRFKEISIEKYKEKYKLGILKPNQKQLEYIKR